MKKTHIFILVLAAVSIAIITSMGMDFSTYETFASAAKQPQREYQVIGYFEKDKPVEYNPATDPNHFSVYVRDKKGDVKKVICEGAPHGDMDKVEQLAMTGRMDGEVFRCSRVQMKCPSKYTKDEVGTKGS